jgi:hypothetical protein
MFHWLKAIFGISPKKTTRYLTQQPVQRQTPIPKRAVLPQADVIDGMNEGDYHSGVHGYSPNTAYPETQYGSGYDSSADWNEGDEN